MQEQAAALRSLGMAQYDELKGRLLLATSSLVAAGTGVAYLLAGLPLAVPFVVGGGLGVVYQIMLQQGVDALPLDTTTDAVQVCFNGMVLVVVDGVDVDGYMYIAIHVYNNWYVVGFPGFHIMCSNSCSRET